LSAFDGALQKSDGVQKSDERDPLEKQKLNIILSHFGLVQNIMELLMI
jgi:hypothetical protein